MRFIIAEDIAEELGINKLPEIRNTSTESGKGDFSSPVGFMFAKELKRKPEEITSYLAQKLLTKEWCEKVEYKSGFLNVYISTEFLFQYLYNLNSDVIKAAGQYIPQYNKKVQIEYVSANPTGPLHVAHGRVAAVGSSLANILRILGVDVTTEFYINDAGEQIKKFALSIIERIKEIKGLPSDINSIEGGYKGEYIKDIAYRILDEYPNILDLPLEEAVKIAQDVGVKLMLEDHRKVLSKYRVIIDVWRSERDIREEGWVKQTIELLGRKGLTYEKDGALWLKTSLFGDDKDRVLIKRNGEYTYFAVDIAYHYEKYNRGFDIVYDIWGSDHYGHIPRMKAAMKGLGIHDEFLQVIIIQIVKFLINGRPIKMSKRAGTFTLLSDLIDSVGVDAARFYFLMHSPDNSMDFDLDLAVKKSMDNPVYYVQYAYTRALSLKNRALSEGLNIPTVEDVRAALLKYSPTREEKILLLNLADVRYRLTLSAKNLSPHFVVNYSKELAGMLHAFYQSQRVIDAETDAAKIFRLALIDRFIEVMGMIHDIIGISKREKM